MQLNINQHWEMKVVLKLFQENAFDVDGVEHNKNDDAVGDDADNMQPWFPGYAEAYIDDLRHL